MLSHQGVELFERIRRISRCGENVSMQVGFEVSKAQAKLRVSLSTSAPCLHTVIFSATMLPTVTIMD